MSVLRRKKTGKTEHRNQQQEAQVIIEFTFCIIMILLIFYGCVMAFRWAGLSLVNRRVAHDTSLTQPLLPGTPDNAENWRYVEQSPLNMQLQVNFDPGTPMNMVFNNW